MRISKEAAAGQDRDFRVRPGITTMATFLTFPGPFGEIVLVQAGVRVTGQQHPVIRHRPSCATTLFPLVS